MEEFSAAEAAKWIHDARLGSPDSSRLSDKLRASGDTVKSSPKTFGCTTTESRHSKPNFPAQYESQDVVDDGTILPASLYSGRAGTSSLAKQINRRTGEHLDGCAVLMTPEESCSSRGMSISRSSAIRDAGRNYVLLERIVTDAAGNTTLKLSRNTKKDRRVRAQELLSSQNYYLCKREYIQKIDKRRIDEPSQSGLR